MAIQNNGQPQTGLVFLDNKPGSRVFIGQSTPTGLVDGDIWIDSDTQNNAGKNLLSVNTITSGSTLNLPVITTEYKDLFILFRGITVSANATLFINVNSNNSNYATGSELFAISNIKASTTTNHWGVELTDFVTDSVFSYGYIRGVYTNAANANVVLDATNAFTSTTRISSINLNLSTGSFTAGSILIYGVN